MEFRHFINKTAELENEREYCCHDLNHLIDTARLAYIFYLESRSVAKISKDVIYAAGLLHDVGRYRQYQDGSDHALVSSKFAEKILEDAGYSIEERAMICKAIKEHRVKDSSLCTNLLSIILWKGDKNSRLCFCCKAKNKCHKDNNMPNAHTLQY